MYNYIPIFPLIYQWLFFGVISKGFEMNKQVKISNKMNNVSESSWHHYRVQR